MLDAIAATGGYRGAIDGTKAQFAKKQLADHIRRLVVAYETQQATEQAEATARSTSAQDMAGIT